MRTTLDIDDDILAAAKDLAKAEGKTAGQVLSDLARRALTTPATQQAGLAEDRAAYDAGDDLFPRFPKREGVVITPDHIRKVQEEIDQEDLDKALCIDRSKQAK